MGGSYNYGLCERMDRLHLPFSPLHESRTSFFLLPFLALLMPSPSQLLRYVQSSEDPPLGLSPYVFVLGVFFAPIASSVCFQSALYRLAQLGLRLRSLLGHAVYAKLLRVMAGGGGEKGDGEEEEEEGKKENGNGRQKGRKQSGGAGGGNEAIGRVNSTL